MRAILESHPAPANGTASVPPSGPTPPRWRRRLRGFGFALLGLTFIAAAIRQWQASRGGAAPANGAIVLRVAHSYNDPAVDEAFADLCAAYTRLHPNVVVKVQAVPLQVYRQWSRTQLVGGEPPDILQPLARGGAWEQLATQYLVPLTGEVQAPNPYNRGTALEHTPWRETFNDDMENGYFLHLMEFYAAPLTVNNDRILYNRDLLREITGRDRFPRTYREWLQVGAQARAWAAAHHRELTPVAVAREDVLPNASGINGLFVRYFSTLTGNMMDRYDMQSWGAPNPTLVLWGLMNGSFDFKQPRLRAACEAVRAIADLCQAGFSSALPDDKRFLFLQQKALMAIGDTREFGMYKRVAGFDVGAAAFPEITTADPEYGKYYTGPYWEGEGRTPLSLAVTRDSPHREQALDFLHFVTSVEQDGAFCARLACYPAIKGAPFAPEFAVFKSERHGTANAPSLVYPNSSNQVYLEQHLPLYLSHQLSFDAFMDGLAQDWLQRGWTDVARTLRLRFYAERQTEFNVSMDRARLLFDEAGAPADEVIRDDRTRYQMGIEIIQMLDANIMRRKYIHANLPKGRYQYPPPVAPAAQATP